MPRKNVLSNIGFNLFRLHRAVHKLTRQRLERRE
jgi:hypothetical protein